VLLGLPFVALGILFLLHKVPEPPLEPGSPAALFAAAFGPTGYMNFVKVCEVIGGLLVMIPRTRNFGLLVLGPIIVNILAYGTLIHHQAFNPVTFAVAALALYLLWHARKQFAGLLN